MSFYNSSYLGSQTQDMIDYGINYARTDNGWILISSTTGNINLNTIINPGNYTFHQDCTLINVPTDAIQKPLNMIVVSNNNHILQYCVLLTGIAYRYQHLVNQTLQFTDWVTYPFTTNIYITNALPTDAEFGAIWIDNSNYNLLKIKMVLRNDAGVLTPYDINIPQMMLKSIYNPTNKVVDPYKYAYDAITTLFNQSLIGGKTVNDVFNEHVNTNGTHVTIEEKNYWQYETITETDVVNAFTPVKSRTDSYRTSQINANKGTSTNTANKLTDLKNQIASHKTDLNVHATKAKIAKWNDSDNIDHMHLTDNKVEIDASQITQGKIDPDRFPNEYKDICIKVATEAAKLALTTSQVQDGDSVYVIEGKKLYYVFDDSRLNNDAGYRLYSAGVGNAIPWTKITDTPTNIVGYGILDAYTATEMQNMFDASKAADVANVDNDILGKQNVWTVRTSGTSTNSLNGITYGNGLYVAVGSGGTILTSTDGITWTDRSINATYHLYGITYGNGLYVAVGYKGYLTTSTDGIIWTNRTIGIENRLVSITYGNGLYVAVGSSNIFTSTDTITWTDRTSGTTNWLNGITYDNGLFVAVGDRIILTSPDGITWTKRTSDRISALYGITYGNGLYVAVGDVDIIYTSTDGINWTSIINGTYCNLQSVTYSNGLYVAVGENGTIITSPNPNGTTWTNITSGTSNHLNSIIYGNGLYVAAGQNGTILTSPLAIDYKTILDTDAAALTAHDLQVKKLESCTIADGSVLTSVQAAELVQNKYVAANMETRVPAILTKNTELNKYKPLIDDRIAKLNAMTS